MTIYLYSGQILLNTGAVAMSPTCCCNSCPCTTPNPIPSPCTQCAASDFPTSFSTPGDWQVDISGVTAGSRTACTAPCTPDTASHTSFFNRSVVFTPCTGQTIFTECIWLCEYFDRINSWNVEVLELNYLEINPPSLGGNGWQASVRMTSFWVSRASSTVAGACTGLTPGFSLVSPGGSSLSIDARSQFSQSFSRVSPTYQQYDYDTTDCDPVTCTNPINSHYYACYPSGWALTAGTATTSWINSCRNACDVTGATVSIYAV